MKNKYHNKEFKSDVSGINVEGMGGVGQQQAQQNLKNMKTKVPVEQSNAYGAQIMQSNAQKNKSKNNQQQYQ